MPDHGFLIEKCKDSQLKEVRNSVKEAREKTEGTVSDAS